MDTSEVNVSAETRVASLVATVTALLGFALVTIGLPRIAALVAALGFFAILERLHRLFVFFRRQRRYLACLTIACLTACAFAAACWPVYLASPLHIQAAE